MKKIVASVGLIALGASGVQAAAPSPFSTDEGKPWSVAATLRGFYDDNYQTLPNNAVLGPGEHRDSFGFEVSPQVNFKWELEQTTIALNYTYGLKYYEHPINGSSHTDQTHSFGASLDHSFNERYQIHLRDSFVIGQEPDQLRAGNTFATFQRIPGENIRNYASLTFNAQLTKQLALEAGYANSLYDYADDAVSLNTTTILPGVSVITVTPSNSGDLDRMEQTFHLDGRYQILPTTVGILGYQFSDVGYTADQFIGGALTNAFGTTSGRLYRSDVRNNRSHYGYLGVDQTFSAALSGSLRAGGRYNDYYNDPYNHSEPSPYVNASMKYMYMPASYAEAGVSYDRSATDLFSDNGVSLTTDAQTVSAWLGIHHKITPRLTGSLTGQIQNSTYQGGTYNNESDTFYLVGLNLTYQFNRYLSGEVGYNYDRLESDIPNRPFDRNRVYIGVTASY